LFEVIGNQSIKLGKKIIIDKSQAGVRVEKLSNVTQVTKITIQ
jgi:hypothetical protein